ncbi:MAG TPA: FliA/WhiG family RNA polymerase sigma factor [Chthonomonas sp.]|jgi:RNA polymerase sigma factor for flagellar operon FliA|uniref:FliA/WhiG family RNA polymerase sigma factor n=1 Tax=Chthonomonas sp. TaxID=2282153 RepID=UPI002B4ABFA2|nr:FliA/WhiG family RNA polymerase sigma factor [Chthonomonas sp.]HLH81141.1 FliA/WhiG family RNA polymerase sigma factor [Chthonomonas sp.]
MRPEDVQRDWYRFKEFQDENARARLIQHFAYLVKITAGRVITNLPPSLDREDLVSAGALGLIKAVDQYDPSRQVKFETYAIALIRGAILEMLREDDWVPRSARERIKMLERTYTLLEARLGRPATEEEVAAELHMEMDEFHKLLIEAGRSSLLSLEEVLVGSENGENLHLSDVIQDERLLPSAEAELQERKHMLGKAIDRLPERERLVISLYYYEGLTFKEIGRILSISESRVYQLHTQAVVRLQGYLQRDKELFH